MGINFKKVFEKQIWTLLFLIGFFIIFFIISPFAGFLQGSLFGLPTIFWALLSLSIAIIHQTYILIIWRLQLHHSKITNRFGEKGFKVFVRGFFVIFGIRIISVFLIAISNVNSLAIINIILFGIGIIFIFPVGWLFYCVIQYFGLERAAGADHFYVEKYRNFKFEKRGIFKYSNNAMFVYGFLVFWIPGLLFASSTALLIALFNHIYICVHYYTLELPDIKQIYSKSDSYGESSSNND